MSAHHIRWALPALAALAVAGNAHAADLEVSGSIATELRSFPREPQFAAQDRGSLSPSTVLEPEAVAESEDGRNRLTLSPFLRVDANDRERTHVDLRAAHWLHLGDRYSLVVGLDRVFWGVTESRHLVDIVNQTDGVEDPDGEDKLGQAMVNLTVQSRVGTVELFWLPFFRERTFPAADARLRGFLPVSEGASFDPAANRHRDWAVRYANTVGALDVGISHFRGTSREPRFLPGGTPDAPEVVPRYDRIDQTGLDAQWTQGAWLWKLEAITRGGHGERFQAAVAGVEYTIFNTFPGRSADLGLLLEALEDGRGPDAPPTVFDHDVFAGLRWALNDVQGTQILGGPVVDRKTGETLLFLEAERRVGDRQSVEVDLRWFLGTDASSPASAFRQDDFVAVRLTRYL